METVVDKGVGLVSTSEGMHVCDTNYCKGPGALSFLCFALSAMLFRIYNMLDLQEAGKVAIG